LGPRKRKAKESDEVVSYNSTVALKGSTTSGCTDTIQDAGKLSARGLVGGHIETANAESRASES